MSTYPNTGQPNARFGLSFAKREKFGSRSTPAGTSSPSSPPNMDHLYPSAPALGGNEIITSTLLHWLTIAVLTRAYHMASRPRHMRSRLSPQTAALACLIGPLAIKKHDKSTRRLPSGLVAILCVLVATMETDLVNGDMRGEVAQILQDNDVVLARNVVFQKKALCFPHRLNILASSTLSYGSLERAPTFLEQASAQLKNTLQDLERVNATRSNLAEPAVLPKFKIVNHHEMVGVHQARLICEGLGMTLAAPRNTTEVRELQAWTLQQSYWNAPGERVWLDFFFDLHEQAFLNALTRERIDLIYPGVDSKQDVYGWKKRIDDHHYAIALILQSGELDFTGVKGMTAYMNGASRNWIKDGEGSAPRARVVCQSFGMSRDNVLIGGDLVSARDLYANQNVRLPLDALKDTDNFLFSLATEERRQIRQLIGRYGLRRLPQTVVPPLVSQSIVPPTVSAPTLKLPSLTNTSDDKQQPPPSAEVEPLQPEKNRQKRDDTWDSSDDADRVLLSIAKAVPVLGLAVASVDDIIRERKLHAFQKTTSKKLHTLERTIAKSARRLAGVEFASEVIDLRVRHLELSVKQMQNHVSATLMSLELNQRLDLIVAEAQALHSEFLVKITEFDRWLAALQRGNTPDQLFTGELLASVRELIRDLGLDARAELQETTSTLVQDPLRIDALQIISNILVSDVPWKIYEMIILPLWQDDHLYQEEVDYKYLAIDSDHQNFVVLTTQQFSDCHNKACILPSPVQPLRQAQCGPIALVGGSANLNCKLNQLPEKDFFAPFSDALAFSVKDTQEIILICPYEDMTPKRKTISGAGVCFIPRGCHLASSDGAIFYGPLSSGLPGNQEHSFICIDTENLDLDEIQENHEEYWAMFKIGTSLADPTPIYATLGVVSTLIILALLACAICGMRRNAPLREPQQVVEFQHDHRWHPREIWNACLGKRRQQNVEPQGNALEGPPNQEPLLAIIDQPRVASPPIPIPGAHDHCDSMVAQNGSSMQAVSYADDSVRISDNLRSLRSQISDTGRNELNKAASTSVPTTPGIASAAKPPKDSPTGTDTPANSTTISQDARSAETARKWRHFGAVPPTVILENGTIPRSPPYPEKPPRPDRPI